MRIRLLFAFLTLVGLLASRPAVAASPQIPGITPSQPAPATPAAATPSVPSDPLGRDNPRGCVLGFMKAAQDENYDVAVRYFEPPARRTHYSKEDEEELAQQLLEILNHTFAGPLDFISRDPAGRLDDGLPADQEKLSNVLGTSQALQIFLVRREDEQGRKLWYFSRSTLQQVPQAYESMQFPSFERKIPTTLVEHRFLSMPIWQWLAMLLFIPVSLLIARLFTLIFEVARKYYRKSRHLPGVPRPPFLTLGPGTLALAVIFHYAFVNSIGTSLLYRLYYRRVVWIILAVAFYWILTRVTRALSARLAASFTRRGMLAERSIVSLMRRFIEVVIFLTVGLFVLHGLGFDVSTALAGVGIGGLALGLGAQKTFENLFGGVSILFDKAVQIGDSCKINNQVATVEDIGLRSTRLRTTERTLLTIPNGTMATATIENLRFRDKFLIQQTIRLRYDLSPDHVRYVLEQIRNLMRDDPKVEDSTARVQFVKFSDYALEIEVYGYILEPDYASYLRSQEAFFLQVMECIDKSGAVVALPTQTTFVSQDSWVDPEKSKKLKIEIDKARDAARDQKPGKPMPLED
jgi:MscS family membrane protein